MKSSAFETREQNIRPSRIILGPRKINTSEVVLEVKDFLLDLIGFHEQVDAGEVIFQTAVEHVGFASI